MKAFSTALSLLLLAAGLSKQLVSATDVDTDLGAMNQTSFEDQAELARSYPYATNIKFKTIRNYCGSATQYSGYVTVAKNTQLYFWFAESRQDPISDPLILWVDGGPGCSSMLGQFSEVGTCTVAVDGSGVKPNPNSWNKFANVLFIDQPVGTGFSYGSKNVTTTPQASEDVTNFLKTFFSTFRKFQNNDFHIFGESYAGHYIPSLGKYILNSNAKSGKKNQINLKSVGISNGLINPLVQFKYYPEMACENDYHPLVSADNCKAMRDSWPSCEKMLQDCQDKKTADVCAAAGDYCNGMYLGPIASSGMNLYDVRGSCERNDDLCYNIFNGVQTYLNKKKVQKMLGVPAIKYESCSMDVFNNFSAAGDIAISHQNEIVDLLQNNIRVLIYAGDADYLCNWKGVQAVAKDLDWTYKAQFNAAETSPWYPTPHPNPLGDLTTYKNLSFLKIFKSGHYIPLDKPEVIYTVASNWVHDNLY